MGDAVQYEAAGEFQQRAAMRACPALAASPFRSRAARLATARGRGRLHAGCHGGSGVADIAALPVDGFARWYFGPFLAADCAFQVAAAADAHREFAASVTKPAGHGGMLEQPAAERTHQ